MKLKCGACECNAPEAGRRSLSFCAKLTRCIMEKQLAQSVELFRRRSESRTDSLKLGVLNRDSYILKGEKHEKRRL